MKKYILFCIPLLFVNCSKPQSGKADQKNPQTVLSNLHRAERFEEAADTTKVKNYIAIFDEETDKAATLSSQELKIVDLNLESAVKEYNKSLKNKIKKWNIKAQKQSSGLRKRKNQSTILFPAIFCFYKQKVRKLVRVFCLCSSFDDSWRKGKLNVHDGGDCFLYLMVNITKNIRNELGSNGYA